MTAPPAGLEAAAGGLDAAARAVHDALAALAVPEGEWRGLAAGAAGREAAALRGRGTELAGRAHALADSVRDAATDPLPVADERLAAALAVALGGSGPRPGACRGPDPVAVAAWWAGLDGAQRERMLRERPDLVGGLDGVPAAERDRANRVLLARAESDALAEQRSRTPVEAVLGRVSDSLGLDLPWNRVSTRLARLAALRAALADPQHRLLAFDEDDGRVRAAVAAGDVDTAAHVGVLTPGFTADVRDLAPRLGELDGVRAAAGPGTAVVAWYGYDAPQWGGLLDPDRSVVGPGAAREGAARLAPFLDGLDATRPADPPHVTAVGHSYGTVTTAQTVAGGADGVDDVVLLGSPGVPDPHVAPGHLWVAEARGDPVADAGWFGPDANRAPGATGLSTREVSRPDGEVLAGVSGHSGYLRPGTTSASGVAAVVGGRSGDAVLDRGVGAGDRLRRLLEPAG